MADVHSKAVRSYNMSQIRSKNTKPELVIRKYLFAKGFRYRLHSKDLCGKPDIVLPKHRTVIFVHGCFWHGHENCKYFTLPKTNNEFWRTKLQLNKERDKRNQTKLKEMGWKVIVIWGCQVTQEQLLKKIMNHCE